jgi:C-terminal processing protease CtpA/Prc
MITRLITLFSLIVLASPAQLTTDQRLADFRNLADLYARRYPAIQWKQTAIGFDLLKLKPWFDRVSTVKTDLDFYDLMVEYVSDLQDAHDQYLLPSDFEAKLGFTVDLYDGKLLIDSMDRSILPAAQYRLAVGDQLMSVDGQAVGDLVKRFSKYVTGGNPRTVQRLAAELIADRPQAEYPYAPQVGDTATVVTLSQSGDAATYTIPWQKSGTALAVLGASPGPNTSAMAIAQGPRLTGARPSLYQQVLQQFRNYTLPGRINVLGFDQLPPVFAVPAGFVQRLGKKTYDSYYSGTYAAPDGTKVGYLRIPDFIYPSLTDLDKEIKYFQINTDVLVVDAMRNPGGDACAAEDILARLTTTAFRGLVAEVRVDWTDIMTLNAALADAQANGADEDTIAQLQLYQSEFQKAFQSNNGRTPPLPVCTSTGSHDPVPNAYTKPVLVLVDEMSASSADIFASMVQDNHIAPLFGYRTMGAGGSPEGDYAGVYTEGTTSVTRSLAVRAQPVVTAEYPTTAYIENVGVRPETVLDFMTTDNLLNHGRGFVDAFTAAAVTLVHPSN